MLDSLRSNFWSGPKAPRLEAWSLDRNRDRTEGERLLRARRHAEAEIYLERAAVDAEKRGHSAPKRIQAAAAGGGAAQTSALGCGGTNCARSH